MSSFGVTPVISVRVVPAASPGVEPLTSAGAAPDAPRHVTTST